MYAWVRLERRFSPSTGSGKSAVFLTIRTTGKSEKFMLCAPLRKVSEVLALPLSKTDDVTSRVVHNGFDVTR